MGAFISYCFHEGHIGRVCTPKLLAIASRSAEFAGFNLITARLHPEGPCEAYYVTNRHPEGHRAGTEAAASGRRLVGLPYNRGYAVPLTNGLYCVSNGHIQDLNWPKVSFLREKVSEAVDRWRTTVDAHEDDWDEGMVARSFLTTVAPWM